MNPPGGNPPHGPGDPLSDVDERLADWVDGRMSPRERERFAAELRVSARLREQAAAYQAMVGAVQSALRAPGPRVDLAAGVLDRLQRQPVAATRGPRAWRPLPALLSVAAAAAIVIAAFLLDRWSPGSSSTTTVAREAQDLGARLADSPDGKPAAGLTADPSERGVPGDAGAAAPATGVPDVGSPQVPSPVVADGNTELRIFGESPPPAGVPELFVRLAKDSEAKEDRAKLGRARAADEQSAAPVEASPMAKDRDKAAERPQTLSEPEALKSEDLESADAVTSPATPAVSELKAAAGEETAGAAGDVRKQQAEGAGTRAGGDRTRIGAPPPDRRRGAAGGAGPEAPGAPTPVATLPVVMLTWRQTVAVGPTRGATGTAGQPATDSKATDSKPDALLGFLAAQFPAEPGDDLEAIAATVLPNARRLGLPSAPADLRAFAASPELEASATAAGAWSAVGGLLPDEVVAVRGWVVQGREQEVAGMLQQVSRYALGNQVELTTNEIAESAVQYWSERAVGAEVLAVRAGAGGGGGEVSVTGSATPAPQPVPQPVPEPSAGGVPHADAAPLRRLVLLFRQLKALAPAEPAADPRGDPPPAGGKK